MADQLPPAPGEAPAAPPRGQMGPKQGADPMKMHDHAIEASKHLEALATGLGQADAEPKVIDAITSMADTVRGIAKAMAKAPAPAPKAPAARPTMASATDELAANARKQPV